MVKGVNKQIIEINDTGNKYFEKVLLFVAPGKKDLPSDLLYTKAQEYVVDFSKNFSAGPSLREKMQKKRVRKRAMFISGTVIALAIISVLIFNFL